MPEFLTNFSNQITEYWNKFSRTQKIQIIAIFVAGLAALVVLTLILSRPTYELYRDDVQATDMNTIKATLDAAAIDYEISPDATSISIDAGKFKDATLALADVGVLPNEGFSYEKYFANLSLTMSTSDKKIMAKLATETAIATNIKAIGSVENANVSLAIPESATSVLERDKIASASIWLDLRGELNQAQVEGIASMVESSIENLSTANIKIFDRRNVKLLYNGSSSEEGIDGFDSRMEYERNWESYYANEIEMLLLNGGIYNDAVVSVNLTIDYDSASSDATEYYLLDGQNGSLPTRTYSMEQSGTNSDVGGVPGTDSNADTTDYTLSTGTDSESSTSVAENEYAVSEKTTLTRKVAGDIIFDQSTVTVTLNKYEDHDEALLEAQGLLTELTWEQYQADKAESTILEVSDDLSRAIENYANISEENVVILGYTNPRFIDKPVAENQVADYIPVIIIVLMIALLGYAVYKGTEPVEITEVEPELSVEDMLASTKVSEELEAIEFDDKSEARVQIEKFVEENPEAVAQLLRNWLNEDWE